MPSLPSLSGDAIYKEDTDIDSLSSEVDKHDSESGESSGDK